MRYQFYTEMENSECSDQEMSWAMFFFFAGFSQEIKWSKTSKCFLFRSFSVVSQLEMTVNVANTSLRLGYLSSCDLWNLPAINFSSSPLFPFQLLYYLHPKVVDKEESWVLWIIQEVEYTLLSSLPETETCLVEANELYWEREPCTKWPLCPQNKAVDFWWINAFPNLEFPIRTWKSKHEIY